jgi:hypothetical protein
MALGFAGLGFVAHRTSMKRAALGVKRRRSTGLAKTSAFAGSAASRTLVILRIFEAGDRLAEKPSFDLFANDVIDLHVAS